MPSTILEDEINALLAEANPGFSLRSELISRLVELLNMTELPYRLAKSIGLREPAMAVFAEARAAAGSYAKSLLPDATVDNLLTGPCLAGLLALQNSDESKQSTRDEQVEKLLATAKVWPSVVASTISEHRLLLA
jgi:hypothetical protein